MLKESLRLWNQLGMWSDHSNETTTDFLQSINDIVYMTCFLDQMIVFSSIFICKSSSNLIAATNFILVMLAGSISFGGVLTLGSRMKSVELLYRKIQAMVELSKKPN